ncbi:MAG: hypothetical protein IJY50_02725 [Clostridia bacterium]|nr:hypothetical protein [Clostridia bacterium]
MNASVKKIVCLVLAIIMVATVGLTALFTLTGAIFTKKITDQEELGELYTKGSLTSAVVVDEVEVSLGTVMDYMSYKRLIKLVVTQNVHEGKVRDVDERIADRTEDLVQAQMSLAAYQLGYTGSHDPESSEYKNFQSNVEYKREGIAAIQEDIDEMEAEKAALILEHEKYLADNYTEEDFTALTDAFGEADFINALGFAYLFGGGFGVNDEGRAAVIHAEEATEEGEGTLAEQTFEAYVAALAKKAAKGAYFSTKTNYVLPSILALMAAYAGLFLALLFAIILVINFVIKLLVLLKNLKNADEALLDKLKSGPLMGFVVAMLLIFSFLKVGMGSEAVMGGCVIVGIVFLGVNCLIGAIGKLMECNFNSEKVLKAGISVVSAVLAVLLLSASLGVATGAVTCDKLADFEKSSYEVRWNDRFTELYKEAENNGTEITPEVLDEMKNKAGSYAHENLDVKFNMTTLMIIIGWVGAITASIGLTCVLCRIAFRTYKAKTGEVRPYNAQFFVAACLLVCGVLLSMGTISDMDSLNTTLHEGKYAILTSEYELDGSYDKLAMETLTEERKLTVAFVDELNKQIDETSDEEAKKALTMVRDNGLRSINYTDNRMEELTDTDIPTVSIILFAVLLLVCEIAYKIVPGKVAKLMPEELLVCGEKQSEEAEAAEPAEAEAAEATEAQEEPATEEKAE